MVEVLRGVRPDGTVDGLFARYFEQELAAAGVFLTRLERAAGVFDDTHAAFDRLLGEHAEAGARSADLQGEAGIEAALFLFLRSLFHRAYQTVSGDSRKWSLWNYPRMTDCEQMTTARDMPRSGHDPSAPLLAWAPPPAP